ncbi:MAG: hypothetical protein ACYDBJ_11525 [Aggregatilineales bacterium]
MNTSGAKASLISSDAGHGDYFYELCRDERPRNDFRAAAAQKVPDGREWQNR